MKPTTLSELKASNYIEAAPNGVLGRFRRIKSTGKWVHTNAIAYGQTDSCAQYSDEEMFKRAERSLRILPSK